MKFNKGGMGIRLLKKSEYEISIVKKNDFEKIEEAN